MYDLEEKREKRRVKHDLEGKEKKEGQNRIWKGKRKKVQCRKVKEKEN